MVFVKIKINEKNRKSIFDLIRSWLPGVSFLSETGDMPTNFSDEEFFNMAQPFLNQKHPDLQQYLIDHNLIENVVSVSPNKKEKTVKVKQVAGD